MSNGDAKKDTLKRVVAFLAGALLTFAVMSITVVAKQKGQNEELAAALDASQYQAGRLLSDARAQLASREYERARISLTTLFDKHPGSAESADGKILLAELEDASRDADAKWIMALPALKQGWTAERAAVLRAESEAARIQMEAGLDAKILQEWEKAKDALRKEWEAAARL